MASFWRFLTALLIIGSRSALYVGIGFICYAYFVENHIDWSSAWFYGYLLAWPLILFGKFAVLGVTYLVPLIVVAAGLFYAAMKLEERQRVNKRKARLAEDRLRRGIIDHK